LAAENSSAAVAAWGRLGYPRRAVRLHAAAGEITTRHGGELPADLDQLRRLPGVGEYTAAAVYSFGFRGRAVVLDTNIRRMLGRLDAGIGYPADHIVAAERERAARYLPKDAWTASRWSAAAMELGALVCTADHPRCSVCPVVDRCTWRMTGYPPAPRARRPGFPGSDRQCRGQLLDIVRHQGETPVQVLLAAWPDAEQAARSLQGLTDDGLVHLSTDGQRVGL
jgi:A/G-specific adenine glycosylase